MPSLFRTTRVPILIVLLTAIFVSASFAFANQLAQDVPPVETVELTSAPDLLTATPVETAETTSEPEVPITPEASPSPTFDETAEPEVPNPEPPIEPVIEEPFVIGAILGVEQVCGYPLSFIVTNTGSALSAGANYEVINVSSAQLVKSGVLPALSNGESSSIPLNIGDNPYDVYEVFISSGGSTLIDVTLTPCQLPTFTLQQVCNYPLAFELTNTGTSLIPGIGAHYEIINVTKSQGANSGLINTLAAGATTTLQLNVGDNPYDSYSIAIEVAGYQVAHFTPTPCQLPTFTLQQMCGYPLAFELTNTGTSLMPGVGAHYEIINVTKAQGANSGLISTLAAGATTTLQLNVGNNPYDSYAVDIEVAGYPVAHFTPTPCQLPTFTLQQVCDYPLAFELTNTGTSLFPDIGAHYEIINVTKAQVADSGLINTLAAGATTTLQLNVGNNPYDSYSIAIEVAGYPVAHFTPMPCQLPTFTVQQVCGYPLAFEVTNTGSDALLPVVGAHYEIINVTKAQSAISGLIDTLAAGATTTLYLNVGDNPYDSYSIHLEVAGYPVAHVTPTPCQVPTFTVQQVCGYPLAFEVTNTGSAALFSAVGADYEIINVTQSQVVNSGNIDTLAAGGTVTLYLNAGDDPFDSYSIVIEVAGYLAAHVTPTPCPTQMLWVTVGATCGAPISFDIINASGSALSNATYAIHNDTENADAQTGQFTLAFLDSMTLTLNGVYDPYDTYSLIVNDGVNPEFSFQRPACERPMLQVQSQCAYPLVFTVTNTGGDFLIPQDYAITTGGNSVDAGQLNLLKGASATFTLTGQNPYLPYVFQSDGAYIPVTPYTQSCTPPVVEIQGYCTTPSFSVINSGGDMLLDHPLVTTWNGQMISLPVTTLHMAANDIVWVSAVGYDLTIPMTLSTNTFNINGAFTLQCLPPAAFPTNTPIPATTPTPAASQSGGGVIDGTTPSVSGQVCGYNCPAFSLYHSDEAGRWEIFRLNGANGQTTLRQNLSFGSEQNADALAPSLSPNSQWIAFASNRDGNWEIYIASTDGDAHSLRRLTINAVAVDTDPVWGPNNMVVFETTRNGNWDLYAADMANGRVFPLVNAPDGDDVNAAWSPDGRRLLFQSDRPDTNGVRKWQIYELNLTTMAITRLSDGSTIDVDPQYSPDGSSIVFRSYTSEGAVSLINLMDVNGANRRVITGEDQDSTNPVWSPQNHYIAYQAVKNGQLDLFLYDVAAGITRQLTDSDVPDYAPSWLCTEDSLLFTSEASGNPDIYEIAVQPISAPPVDVLQGATRLTFGSANDVYPLSFPSEENASREGASGSALLSQQTTFVPLSLSLTAPEISLDGEGRAGWESLDVCTP